MPLIGMFLETVNNQPASASHFYPNIAGAKQWSLWASDWVDRDDNMYSGNMESGSIMKKN